MNIAEILKKYAKQYDTFYTLTNGEAQFHEVKNDAILLYDRNEGLVEFNRYGELCSGGECLIFPSKEQRDWDEYVRLKEDVEAKVGDHVWYGGEQYIIMRIEEEEANIMEVVSGWVKRVLLKDLTIADKFDHTMLKPFDRVLVRDTDADCWKANFFSHIRSKEERCDDESGEYKYSCVEDAYCECIPYNDETRHLVGTTNEAPEFYRE